MAGEVEQILVEVTGLRQDAPRVLDLTLELPGNRRLTGTVSGVYGTTLVSTSFGKVNHKRRFRSWLTLLLLYVQSYFKIGTPILPSKLAIDILVRSVIIVLTWYFVTNSTKYFHSVFNSN